MKLMRNLVLGIALLSCVNCAKEPPNLSPTAHAQFVSDKYIVALSDFQDGVEVGYRAGWLSKANTHIVAQVLAIAFVTIHESPNGAKASALKAIDEIKTKVGPELAKFAPYLDSLKKVVEAL